MQPLMRLSMLRKGEGFEIHCALVTFELDYNNYGQMCIRLSLWSDVYQTISEVVT